MIRYAKQSLVLRFRRWSRAKYAAFCSLSKNVSIGQLKVSIADSSLKKSNSISFANVISAFSFAEDEKETDENLLLSGSLATELLFGNLFSVKQNNEYAQRIIVSVCEKKFYMAVEITYVISTAFFIPIRIEIGVLVKKLYTFIKKLRKFVKKSSLSSEKSYTFIKK